MSRLGVKLPDSPRQRNRGGGDGSQRPPIRSPAPPAARSRRLCWLNRPGVFPASVFAAHRAIVMACRFGTTFGFAQNASPTRRGPHGGHHRRDTAALAVAGGQHSVNPLARFQLALSCQAEHHPPWRSAMLGGSSEGYRKGNRLKPCRAGLVTGLVYLRNLDFGPDSERHGGLYLLVLERPVKRFAENRSTKPPATASRKAKNLSLSLDMSFESIRPDLKAMTTTKDPHKPYRTRRVPFM